MSRRTRLAVGIPMVAASVLLLFPSLALILAPLIARVILHGYYSLTVDTVGAQQLAVSSLLAGAGLVGASGWREAVENQIRTLPEASSLALDGILE